MANIQSLISLIEREGFIVAPACYDPLSARIIESLKFKAAYLGGFVTGASLCITEPLTTMTEFIIKAKEITDRLKIPLIVDAGAGFGEPLHVMRTVREFESIGVAGIHIEDQHYPKRAHYHKGIEQVIPVDSMIYKLSAALKARENKNFVIIARTDAMKTEGYQEGVRRANIYAEAGADLVIVYPNDKKEAASAPKDIHAQLVYVNSRGDRRGRAHLSAKELADYGYKMLIESNAGLLFAYRAIKDVYKKLYDSGSLDLDKEEMIALRLELEDIIGLNEYYKIEEETLQLQ